MTDQTKTNPAQLDSSTMLAVERTRVAYDRTMLAWTRTATSLITFGFTIYKFFQIDIVARSQKEHVIGPREFGLTLVCIGLFSLLLATLENRKNMGMLRSLYPDVPRSMATLLAAVISLLGVLALVVMIVRA